MLLLTDLLVDDLLVEAQMALRNVVHLSSYAEVRRSHLLLAELIEVSCDVVDALFVHGNSLLKDVESSGNDIKLTHNFFKSLSKLFSTSSNPIV